MTFTVNKNESPVLIFKGASNGARPKGEQKDGNLMEP